MERTRTILMLLLLCAGAAAAQGSTVIIGADAYYAVPVGTLGDRFRPAAGFSVSAGQQADDDWTWLGRLDRVEFTELNTEKLTKSVVRQNVGSKTIYTFPLQKLSMDLTATGLSAVGKYNLIRTSFLESDLQIGFGFTHWSFRRGAYRDSLVADSAGTKLTVGLLNVPANEQTDWSGTVQAGFNADIRLAEPVWLHAGAQYTLIIGELWQALAL
ncbi:MAG: hypothetical protein HUU02_09615, partial [Bacteroidetes bacterium]|nr:hypothetical protein [Bacteroidota bacterium]